MRRKKIQVFGEEKLEELEKEENKSIKIKQISDWFSAHKDKIIMVLAALISFFTSLEVFGGKGAIYCTIIVAFIEILIYYIKNGLTETFLEMCVNTALLIVNAINGKYTIEKNITVETETKDENNNVKSSKKRKKVKICLLTEPMIREYILTGKPIKFNDETK